MKAGPNENATKVKRTKPVLNEYKQKQDKSEAQSAGGNPKAEMKPDESECRSQQIKARRPCKPNLQNMKDEQMNAGTKPGWNVSERPRNQNMKSK